SKYDHNLKALAAGLKKGVLLDKAVRDDEKVVGFKDQTLARLYENLSNIAIREPGSRGFDVVEAKVRRDLLDRVGNHDAPGKEVTKYLKKQYGDGSSEAVAIENRGMHEPRG